MERKFVNKIILGTSREIEEILFFRQFLENIGNCYQQYFEKNKDMSQLRPMKIWKNTAISGIHAFFV